MAKTATGKDSLALYRLADGTAVGSVDCEENDDGVLVSKETGVPVVMDSDGNPKTLGKEKEVQEAGNLTGEKTQDEESGDQVLSGTFGNKAE